MTSVKVIDEEMAFNTRKKESFKIPEEVWREKVVSGKYLEIKLATMKTKMIKNETLNIKIRHKRLLGGVYFESKDNVEGSGRVIIRKPGMKGIGDQGYNAEGFAKLKWSWRNLCWTLNNWLEDEGTLYNQEEFLKNYLENGFVTVEVISEMSVKGENMENKKAKEKEAVVRDINNFCKDKSSSDFLIICEGEEIPCHRIILCSRCPVIADGLAAQMSEDSSARWTVTDSNPEAVKDMLHYLYTGEVQGLETRPTELLHLATFYRLPQLKKAIKEELIRRLTVENAVETLVNMDKFAANDDEVKEKVTDFIKKNAKKVVEGKDWKVFCENYTNLVADIIKAIVN